MKIAIVTDDHQTISAHFGRAQFYEVFTIEAGQVIARETFAKPNHQVVTVGGQHQPEGEHHHQHDHNAMLAPLTGCQVMISRGMGWGAHNSLKENGLQPLITDLREIEAAVTAYLTGTLLDHPERLH
jgi:predicted Fe-Mo cluster-binding NifX family protein